MPQLDGEEGPDLDLEGKTRILCVPKHRRDAHNGEANPEEVEKAVEVAVVRRRVEVRDARGELYGREDAPPLLGAGELAGGGKGLGRWGGIFGDGC